MFNSKLKNVNENKISFNNKTYSELQELLMRQNKILSNNSFIDGLPDKGEKLKRLRAQIEEELNKRFNCDQLCQDMSSLNIGKDQLDTLEWTGKHVTRKVPKNSQLKVNDSDRDVLKMFVSHSGVNQKKIIIKEKPEEKFIKPSDLIKDEPVKDEIDDETTKFPMELYAKNLCGRIDNNVPTKNHFLLNKPAIPNKYSTVKAASLSLKESFILQCSYENKMKELGRRCFIDRPNLRFNTSSYRETATDYLDEEDSDVESIINNDDY